MRKFASGLLLLALTLPAIAGTKIIGTTTLKDFQPAGAPDRKQHQSYDLSFTNTDKNYTCRTNPGKKTNASDFVVGSPVHFEIDGQKVKIKTQQGKQAECRIVRVEAIPAAP